MKSETFYVGLTRRGCEIAAPGYARRRLVLTQRQPGGYYKNELEVAFAAAVVAYGFIDGLALCGSLDGPVIAVSPLTLPMHVMSCEIFVCEPGQILMSEKSLAAIAAARPIAIAS